MDTLSSPPLPPDDRHETAVSALKASGEKAAQKPTQAQVEDAVRTLLRWTGDDIVTVRDIPFHSHCEHHMVPIIGKAHVAYLPKGRVLGLSKIARVIEVFARRLQTQENMTAQVANAIQDALQPRGVAVMIEAEHMCMAMRGIRKQGSTTTTTTFTGDFKTDPHEQVRFMTIVKGA